MTTSIMSQALALFESFCEGISGGNPGNYHYDGDIMSMIYVTLVYALIFFFINWGYRLLIVEPFAKSLIWGCFGVVLEVGSPGASRGGVLAPET